MGNRAVFITEQNDRIELSKEFVEKYDDRYNFNKGNSLPISSKTEIKRGWDDFEDDFVIELTKYNGSIKGVWMYEDDTIESIKYSKEGFEPC